MVKRILLSFVLILSLLNPVMADQELDANSDGKIDDALYSAYGNLSAESKIGTGATQVSQGNHTHSYLAGTLSATNGAVVCTTGTGQATAAACGGVGSAGLVKWGATGVPATATAGSDYVATETDPVVKAINGIVKSNTSTISAATRSDYDAVQIVGDASAPQSIAANYDLTAANAYGTWIHTTGTGSVNLPSLASGMSVCVSIAVSTDTATITPSGTQKIRSAGADKATLTITGANDGYVCILSDGQKWRRAGYEGTLGGT